MTRERVRWLFTMGFLTLASMVLYAIINVDRFPIKREQPRFLIGHVDTTALAAPGIVFAGIGYTESAEAPQDISLPDLTTLHVAETDGTRTEAAVIGGGLY